MHHAAQLLLCGGLQAEMAKSLEWATHVNFRSSYNLLFEVVRRDGGKQVYHCEDGDAYTGNQTFQHCLEKKRKLFRTSRKKSFGVRDETRASGLAVRSMLDDAIQKANAFLETNPIVWIPSHFWFGLLERRMLAIRATQMHLLRRDPLPSNLGIVSSVLMYMVRAATITPVVMKAYLTQALQDLHQAEHMEMWGMFFIKCLDLRNDNIMDLVEPEDDDQVLRDCGGAVARKNIAQRRMQRFMRKRGQVTPEFPFGENPTWQELSSQVKTQPERIMKEWVWSPLFDGHAQAARFFVKMSRNVWFQAFDQDHFRAPSKPRIICLEDAMKSWSVKAICVSVRRPSFVASNAGIEGASRQGKASASFVSLRKNLLFFPPTAKVKAASSWKELVDVGYIRDYHRYLHEHGEEHITALHDALDHIFENIHCLPWSTDIKIWQANKETYGPIFRTNPTFYKIRGLRKGTRNKEDVNPFVPLLPRVEVSRKTLRDNLEAEEHGIGFVTARKERVRAAKRNKKRSAKSKNARKPPARGKKRAQTPDESADADSSSSESEEDDDDSDNELIVQTKSKGKSKPVRSAPTVASIDHISNSDPNQSDNPSPQKRRRVANQRSQNTQPTQQSSRTQSTARMTRARARQLSPASREPSTAIIRKTDTRRKRTIPNINSPEIQPQRTTPDARRETSDDEGGETSEPSSKLRHILNTVTPSKYPIKVLPAFHLPPKPALRAAGSPTTPINLQNRMSEDERGQSSDASPPSRANNPFQRNSPPSRPISRTNHADSDDELSSSDPRYSENNEPGTQGNIMTYDLSTHIRSVVFAITQWQGAYLENPWINPQTLVEKLRRLEESPIFLRNEASTHTHWPHAEHEAASRRAPHW
ncbi:hypothetical protein BD410DRAFT_810525 [Rickenella mellea]|uniref:Uncharacterized protein n=1 Tax=Rickenella mellea TaxID=50990 RepID=A0A4Y7PEM3_9AGAM|nr:hypothetical protein BD410DRAFT_810525 [Rickenella mellea]